MRRIKVNTTAVGDLWSGALSYAQGGMIGRCQFIPEPNNLTQSEAVGQGTDQQQPQSWTRGFHDFI